MSIHAYSKTTSKGTHTMPEEVRLLLAVQPGDQIHYKHVNVENNEAVIEVIHTKNIVEELGGSLKSNVKQTSQKNMDKIVAKHLAKELGLTK